MCIDPYSIVSTSDNPLPNNGRYEILDSGRTLRITRVQSSDNGVYVCRAESAAGRMEAEAELQVSSQGML